jgi:hypothetical protein
MPPRAACLCFHSPRGKWSQLRTFGYVEGIAAGKRCPQARFGTTCGPSMDNAFDRHDDGKTLVSIQASPSPNTHREHRPQEPHECALPSYLDRRLLPLPPPRPLQRRYLLQPTHRRFPNPPARRGTILLGLPIAQEHLRLVYPRTTPGVAHGGPGFCPCGPDFPSETSSSIVFSWLSSSQPMPAFHARSSSLVSR